MTSRLDQDSVGMPSSEGMGSQVPPNADRPADSTRTTLLIDTAVTALILLVMMAIAYRYLPIYGKTNVWEGDGLGQHFPEIYFWNHWVRGFLKNPSAGLPLWSWTLGMGADIIGTLAFPIVGDPFAWISLAFPMKNMETAMLVVYLTRVLAAGLAATAYFRTMRAKALPAAMGAVVYVFTVFLLFITLRHPFFVNAMVALPLVLIGVEWVLEGRRGWFFTLAVVFSAYSNFYFFYMITIIAALYFVLRLWDQWTPETGVRPLLMTTVRAVGYYVVGVLLAAPLLAPAALAVMSTARTHTTYAVGPLYPLWDYRVLLEALASAVTGPKETYLGIAAIGLLSLVAIFVRKSGNRALRWMPIILGVLVCLPFAGSMFNGFSFPSNRFAFSLALFCGAAVAVRFSDKRPFSAKEIGAMATAVAVYGALVIVIIRPLSAAHIIPLLLGLATVLVLAGERSASRRDVGGMLEMPSWASSGWRMSGPRWLVLGFLVVNVALTATFLHSIDYRGNMVTFIDRHTVLKRYRENLGQAAARLDLSPLARVTNSKTIVYNSSMVQGFPGTSFYYSTMPAPTSNFREEIDNRSGWSQFAFDGFDERAMPTALAAVEYYITDRERSTGVPYGFVKDHKIRDGIVYRNERPLPFGFVYHQAIDRADYLRLAPIDRQSAMLQGAVVDGSKIGDVPRITPRKDSVSVPYRVASATDAQIDVGKGTIVRENEDSRIALSITPVPDAELYVQMTGIKDVVVPFEEPVDPKLPNIESRVERIAKANKLARFQQPNQIHTVYRSGRVGKTARWQTPGFLYSWGHDSQLVNLGYSEDGNATVTIQPREAGRLKFKSLDVLAMPMKPYREYVSELAKSPMTNIKSSANRLSGTVNSEKPGILFLSMPYSPGWSARVDGKPAEVLQVNTGYSGVPVPAGEHQVELSYSTPGLKSGLIAGAIGLIAVFVFLLGTVMVRTRRSSRGAE